MFIEKIPALFLWPVDHLDQIWRHEPTSDEAL
jgi:hypothetical protein